MGQMHTSQAQFLLCVCVCTFSWQVQLVWMRLALNDFHSING